MITGAARAAEKVSFNRDIRTILSDICFACHGPDVSKVKGGLRLDSKEAAMKGGESGPAIVPGNAGEVCNLAGGWAKAAGWRGARRIGHFVSCPPPPCVRPREVANLAYFGCVLRRCPASFW